MFTTLLPFTGTIYTYLYCTMTVPKLQAGEKSKKSNFHIEKT